MKLTTALFAAFACISLPLISTSCKDSSTTESESTPAVKKDTPDSLTDEVLVQMNAMADALSGAKDKETAEAGVKKVEAVADELLAISKRMEAIDAPSDEKREELSAKMKKAMGDLETRMTAVFKELSSNQEVMAIVGPAMMGLEKKLKPAEETFKKFGKTDD